MSLCSYVNEETRAGKCLLKSVKSDKGVEMKGASKFQHFPHRKVEKPRPSCLDVIRSWPPKSKKSVETYIYFFNTPSLKVKMVFHQYIGWLKCVPTLLSREHIKLPVISSKISWCQTRTEENFHCQMESVLHQCFNIQGSRGNFSVIEANCQLPILWFNSFLFSSYLDELPWCLLCHESLEETLY